jgi:hypothetical protein
MARPTRQGGRGRRRAALVPRAIAPLVGAAVLVASARVIDAAWRRTRGMSAAEDDSVSGRLLHASLLGAALRLAERLGLPDARGSD